MFVTDVRRQIAAVVVLLHGLYPCLASAGVFFVCVLCSRACASCVGVGAPNSNLDIYEKIKLFGSGGVSREYPEEEDGDVRCLCGA